MKKTPSILTITSHADLERQVRCVLAAQLMRESNIADRDQKIAEVSTSFNEAIAFNDSTIELGLQAIEQWAEDHRDEFGAGKSILVDGHRLGWRTGPHAAKLVKGFKSWAVVLAKLRKAGKAIRERYVRVKYEVNKDAAIEDRDLRGKEKLLRRYGIEIKQEEIFFLDPDREGQDEKRLTKEAA